MLAKNSGMTSNTSSQNDCGEDLGLSLPSLTVSMVLSLPHFNDCQIHSAQPQRSCPLRLSRAGPLKCSRFEISLRSFPFAASMLNRRCFFMIHELLAREIQVLHEKQSGSHITRLLAAAEIDSVVHSA
jgi:hypothetical protein